MTEGAATSATPAALPTLGLRERKKIKTRLAIQQHALRLIRQQGYEATTVEQIAEAAEISPSTFFRYFPTKDAVVLTDDYDPLLIEAIRAQPAEVGMVRAFRNAYGDLFSDLSRAEQESFFERAQIILEVPDLRASFLDDLAASITLVMDVITERTGRSRDEVEVRAAAGAIMGVAITEFLYWSRHPEIDFNGNIDQAMAALELAFPW
jgi:AcrR family transcriptional regulator